ncbi:unnamed protein product [Gordionus sp. m RMFG-2023]
MKVKLAVQVFSASVANSLLFAQHQEIPGFENCDGTINFILMIDQMFDYLNTRNCLEGLILSMKSILEMGKELLTGETPKMKFFLTYKTSQDHLELYFCSICSRGGFNDNPSAYQQYNLIINKSCDDRIKKDECL